MTVIKKVFNKKWIRLTAYFIGALIFIQTVVYFSADFFLRNYIQEKVRVASKDKYELDFERFHLSIIDRGFSFDNLYLIPKEENISKDQQQPYYKVFIPKISVKRIFYSFIKKEIQLGEIRVKTPLIDLLMAEGTPDKEGLSTVKTLEQQIKKSFLKSSINEIRIKKLFVDEADLLMKNFISQRSISAENTNVYLEDIQLLQERSPKSPFNAKGFKVNLENFQLLLADSVHTIKAAEVNVSSLDQIISAKKVALIPNLNKQASNYLNIQLEDLMLTEADINKVFETATVDVGTLTLNQPKIDLKNHLNSDNQLLETFDFYALIEGILTEINIEQLKIKEGQFQQKIIEESYTRISADQIDFDLQGIYIGPNKSLKSNQFFFAKDAILDIKNVGVAISQGTHLLKGKEVHLSSIQDIVKIKELTLHPVRKTSNENQAQYNISIPNVTVEQANLKTVYQEGILDVAKIFIDQPQIALQNLQKEKDLSSNQLKNIAEEYLKAVYIKNLEIKEGTFVLDNNLQWKQDSLSFGKINLTLENFSLDEKTQDLPSFFLAEHLTLELQDYALKLSDDLHIFKAKSLLVNTKNSTLEITNFSLAPSQDRTIQSLLNQYNKTSNIDIFIPKFTAFGIDYNKAFLESKLFIDKISIPSPRISFVQHYNPVASNDNNIKELDFLNILQNYFDQINIQLLELKKGSLSYENHTKDKLRTFAEENINITIHQFKIDEHTSKEDVGNLFSEEVNISLNNYVFNLADGKYNIYADQVIFNSSKEEIITKNVRLNPNNKTSGKVGISASIPTLSFKGIDLEAFLLDNTLSLNRLLINDAQINMTVDKDVVKQEQKAKSKTNIQLPKNIDIISIDTVETINSLFFLNLKEDKKQNELINSKINMIFYDFHLDSAKIKNQNLNQIFSGLTLSIDDFWLTLPDSLHRLTFSKIALDTRYEGILLHNLRIIPDNLSGKPGLPVFSGYIPTTLIKVASLADMNQLKEMTINDIQLYKPDIEIFTDTIKTNSQKSRYSNNLPDFLKNSKIQRFEIIEGNLSLIDKNWTKKPQHFYELNAQLSDLDLEFQELIPFQKEKLLQKNFVISLPNLEFSSKDNLYTYSIDWVNLENEWIQLKNIRISPNLGFYATNRALNTQTDIADIKIDNLRVYQPKYELFLQNNTIQAKKLEANKIVATLFRDKRYPIQDKKFKPMPQLLMSAFDFPLHLDTLAVNESHLTYVEFPKKGFIPGSISFEQMSFSFYPWIMGTVSPEENYTLFDGKWSLNGEAKFIVQGKLSLHQPYTINLNAEVGAFDLKTFNGILKPNVLAKINSGKVEHGKFQMQLNDEVATGKMTLIYNDIEIQLLDGQTLEQGKGKKNILTFVINNLAIKKNNPRKWSNKTHEASIYFPRDDSRFVFNYIWNATLTGIKETLGIKTKSESKEKKK